MVKIRHGIKAAGMDAGDLAGSMADILRSNDVGRPEKISQADQDKMIQPLGHADTKGDTPGAVLFFCFQQILGNRAECLRPGNPLPFALPFFPHSFEGMLQAIGMGQTIR